MKEHITAGPWELSRESHGLIIYSGNVEVCTVAEIDHDSHGSQAANARLIEAAPDLLALAERVADFWAYTDAPMGKTARDLIARIADESRRDDAYGINEDGGEDR